jgi:hypothetical protein
MPFGLTASSIWLSAAILWVSGWKDELAGDLPRRAVAIWLGAWPFLAWRMFAIGPKAAIGGAVIWAVLAAVILLWKMSDDERRIALSAGFFCCTLGVMVTYLLMPLFSGASGTTVVAVSVIIGWIASLWGKRASVQIVAVTMATIMPEIWKWVAPLENERAWIGSGQWMAAWWIGMAAARLATYLYNAAAQVRAFVRKE